MKKTVIVASISCSSSFGLPREALNGARKASVRSCLFLALHKHRVPCCEEVSLFSVDEQCPSYTLKDFNTTYPNDLTPVLPLGTACFFDDAFVLEFFCFRSFVRCIG